MGMAGGGGGSSTTGWEMTPSDVGTTVEGGTQGRFRGITNNSAQGLIRTGGRLDRCFAIGYNIGAASTANVPEYNNEPFWTIRFEDFWLQVLATGTITAVGAYNSGANTTQITIGATPNIGPFTGTMVGALAKDNTIADPNGYFTIVSVDAGNKITVQGDASGWNTHLLKVVIAVSENHHVYQRSSTANAKRYISTQLNRTMNYISLGLTSDNFTLSDGCDPASADGGGCIYLDIRPERFQSSPISEGTVVSTSGSGPTTITVDQNDCENHCNKYFRYKIGSTWYRHYIGAYSAGAGGAPAANQYSVAADARAAVTGTKYQIVNAGQAYFYQMGIYLDNARYLFCNDTAGTARQTLGYDGGNDLRLGSSAYNLLINAPILRSDAAAGLKLGKDANDKLGFWGKTPVTQRLKANYANWAALSNVVQALVDVGIFDAA